MSTEVQLISDGDGLAVIGDPAAVEVFLSSEGLESQDLGLPRIGDLLTVGAGATQAASEVAASSGRWVKLTEESARKIKQYGLRENADSGLSTGVLKGDKGRIKGFVEFAKTPGAGATNPAVLAGAAGLMAQLAMQQTMSEITDYLATIEGKVDDVLRAQKDAVLARMIGMGFVIEEALTVRDSRGRVDEVTWSKVHDAPAIVAEVQAYALRQLDALAEKLERRTRIGDLAEAAEEAQSKTQEWLMVLARCFQLLDAIGVLELDRVLDSSPAELDGHRLGLRNARQKRLDSISRTTARLLARLDVAVGTANAKVLTHPSKAPALVRSSNEVAVSLIEFHSRLGVEDDRVAVEARRWREAATDARVRAIEAGSEGVDVARRVGGEAFGRARNAGGRVSNRLSGRVPRRNRNATDASADTVLDNGPATRQE